jgi:hypothetical protein
MTSHLLARRWPPLFAQLVRFVIAPFVLFSSGFFTTDFLLSGVYTWPRTSRVFVLTLTMCVLAYEFVYKEQQARLPRAANGRPLKALLYSCAIPYILGAIALLALARFAAGGGR